jgi:hypothetical protein
LLVVRGRPLAIQGGTVRKGPLPGVLHLCGEKMMMMYETAMLLEPKEDMTDGIIWEENPVFIMETDGLCCLPGIVGAGVRQPSPELHQVAGSACQAGFPQW